MNPQPYIKHNSVTDRYTRGLFQKFEMCDIRVTRPRHFPSYDFFFVLTWLPLPLSPSSQPPCLPALDPSPTKLAPANNRRRTLTKRPISAPEPRLKQQKPKKKVGSEKKEKKKYLLSFYRSNERLSTLRYVPLPSFKITYSFY